MNTANQIIRKVKLIRQLELELLAHRVELDAMLEHYAPHDEFAEGKPNFDTNGKPNFDKPGATMGFFGFPE